MACLDNVRLAPTLPIFSEVWGGLLSRLHAEEEDVVRAWLQAQYTVPVPAAIAQEHRLGGSATLPPLVAALFWQRQLTALGGKGNVVTSLQTMQALYQVCWAWFLWWADDKTPPEAEGKSFGMI